MWTVERGENYGQFERREAEGTWRVVLNLYGLER